ncbi:kynureninase [Acidaminobacter hydrogenoformans]|uniref:Kynureninase n=1 Tax=Acidaminobacter hydrogenoformans DSM 2784 TaxID=1120920 RepID=A0A1G5RTD5_9FIRM|nr:kynureninase [Acidaminobacter hydrogenoformans]SCZ77333.1 Kynureninase [Acidaminobacter hydrogenoformans DSM 2784]
MSLYEKGVSYAAELDGKDPLRMVRNEFFINDDVIYMDGNSLGLFPKAAEASLLRVLEDYKRMGIDCWTKTEPQLFLYQDYLGAMMAGLVGAAPEEVTVMSNTTLNLHSMIATFYEPTDQRYKILVDDLTFPTSRYAIESQLRLKGLSPEAGLKEVKSLDGRTLDEDFLIEAMTEDVAMAVFPSVLYRSGQLLDVARLTKAAHERGIIIGFDCCHGVGAVPHEFSKWDVDFAVWCTYKYLNGGPGANAALFLNKRHFGRHPGLAGWQGYVKDKQFDLLNTFEPLRNAGGWQSGTQNIFSMAPLEGSLEIFNRLGMDQVREKSLKLTDYLMALIDDKLTGYGFSVGNPREPERRGGHVALEHDDAVRINQALKDNGVMPDFRAPNVIRLAPIALYTSFTEVFRVVETLVKIMEEKLFENYSSKRGTVA